MAWPALLCLLISRHSHVALLLEYLRLLRHVCSNTHIMLEAEDSENTQSIVYIEIPSPSFYVPLLLHLFNHGHTAPEE